MNWLYFVGWKSFRCFFRLYFRWRIHDAHHVPLTGPVLLAANHLSFVDPPMIGAAIHREINYLARKSLFSVPVVGWLIRKWNAVPVDRDGGGAAGLRAILERIQAGGAIILFPEGTRSKDGTLKPAQSGVGLIAIKTKAPVIPVRVFGSFEAWGRHMKIPRPRQIQIKFGPPVPMDALRAEAATAEKARVKAIYQEAADLIMEHIANIKL